MCAFLKWRLGAAMSEVGETLEVTVRWSNSAISPSGTWRSRLLDHLVGAHLDRGGYGDAQRLGRLEVDDQLELGRPLDWQVGRRRARHHLAGHRADLLGRLDEV